MKNYKYILIIMLFYSCASKNINLEPIKAFINNPKLKERIITERGNKFFNSRYFKNKYYNNPDFSEEKIKNIKKKYYDTTVKYDDSVFIITPLSSAALRECSFPWTLKIKTGDCSQIKFKDSLDAFLLSDEEVLSIKSQIKTDTLSTKLKKSIIVKNNPSLLKLTTVNKLFLKKRTPYDKPIKKELVYGASKPIFIRNNTIALFVFVAYTSDQSYNSDPYFRNRTIIMKKEKNKWRYIGEILDRDYHSSF